MSRGNGHSGCELFAARLRAGERPGVDAILTAHVRSCLGCYRLAAELAEDPGVTTALRAMGPADGAQPGEAFWAAFPARVADEWEAGRLAAALRNTSAAPSDPGEAFWAALPTTLGDRFDEACVTRALRQQASKTDPGEAFWATLPSALGDRFDEACVTRALRQQASKTDPGEAFWAAFPARVADEWSRKRARPPIWERLREATAGWLRWPVPVALAGVAALALWMRSETPRQSVPAGPTAAARMPELVVPSVEPPAPTKLAQVAPVAQIPKIAMDEVAAQAAEDEAIDEGYLRSLDAAGLELLLSGFEQDLGGTVAVRRRAAGAGETDETREASADTDGGAAEELELLDVSGLVALSENLGRRIR